LQEKEGEKPKTLQIGLLFFSHAGQTCDTLSKDFRKLHAPEDSLGELYSNIDIKWTDTLQGEEPHLKASESLCLETQQYFRFNYLFYPAYHKVF